MSYPLAFEVGRLYLPIAQIAQAIGGGVSPDIIDRVPALLHYWPMAKRQSTGNVADSHSGFPLAPAGDTKWGVVGQTGVINLDGTGDYLANASVGDIQGDESDIEADLNGLTICGWFYVENATAGLFGRWNGSSDRAYGFSVSSGAGRSLLSANGSDVILGPDIAVVTAQWTFCGLRFRPGVGVDTVVNGQIASTATAETTINSSSGSFQVGAIDSDDLMQGAVAHVFMTPCAVPSSFLIKIYNQTRGLFD